MVLKIPQDLFLTIIFKVIKNTKKLYRNYLYLVRSNCTKIHKIQINTKLITFLHDADLKAQYKINCFPELIFLAVYLYATKPVFSKYLSPLLDNIK